MNDGLSPTEPASASAREVREPVREPNPPSRRYAFSWLSTAAMLLGLGTAYGTLAAFMGRFLFPARPPARGWMYVSDLERLPAGGALLYRTPSGATVNVARQGKGSSGEDFIALSSTCPHLGCQVHWEPHNDRFFCPCHNGVFDPSGVAVSGPPAEAGQSLPEYPLKVEGGLLYIEVPLAELALGPGRILDRPSQPVGPGHDPCLAPRPPAAAGDRGCRAVRAQRRA